MSRVIVVGDLQGMYDETVQLLDKCKATKDDWVIFAGDLIDRGPDNDKCIDLAIRRQELQGRPSTVLGNHEEKHLQSRRRDEQGRDPQCVIPTHISTRSQLKDHHYDFMKQMPLYLRIPEHNAAVVHAGCYPGRPLEAQDPQHLLHIQMIQPYDKWGNPTRNYKSMWPSKAPKDEGWQFWTNFWDGPERIIFGHSVLDKPLLTDKVCGIDGGACFGRFLHAVILPQWEIVSVEAKIDHGKGSRGRTGDPIRTYAVHGDVCSFS